MYKLSQTLGPCIKLSFRFVSWSLPVRGVGAVFDHFVSGSEATGTRNWTCSGAKLETFRNVWKSKRIHIAFSLTSGACGRLDTNSLQSTLWGWRGTKLEVRSLSSTSLRFGVAANHLQTNGWLGGMVGCTQCFVVATGRFWQWRCHWDSER